MSVPLFMSLEHVKLLNERLAGSEEVRAACVAMPGPASMGYCLNDGPDGDPVHWTVSFTDTVRFSLVHGQCDVVYTGDWRQTVASLDPAQSRQPGDHGLVTSGDETLLPTLNAVLGVAQLHAAVPVTFPPL